MEQFYDVLVVGGGPAGLSAALALARARRSVLVVDDGHPRNVTADHVHNFLTAEGMTPADLLATGRTEVGRYGGTCVTGRVDEVTRSADGFVAKVNTGAVRSRRLLVATGLVDQLPDVPGLAERWGREVLHCPHCNGWEFRDRRIGVLATEPAAAQRAAVWRQWSQHVVLLSHAGEPPTGDQAEWLRARGIPVAAGLVVEVIVNADKLTGVRLATGHVVALDALVVTPRYDARADLLTALGVEPEDVDVGGNVVGRQIPADPFGGTSIPGVWVAGNVADLRGHALMAAAAGLSAAVAINADLVAEDTRVAIEVQRRAGLAPTEAS